MSKGDDYYLKSKERILEEFRVNLNEGLGGKQVVNRVKRYGENIIKKTHKLRPIRIFFEQFHSFLIYILLASAIIMFFLDQMFDAIVIFAIVILNGGIGFFQQYKAERAIEGLREMIVLKTRVLRDGKMMLVDSMQLVPGDIVFLEEGDKVVADMRILSSLNLETNEAVLTGESLSVSKSDKVISKKVEVSKQSNMVFAGTSVVRGNCKAVVVATAKDTLFGKIAETLQEIETVKTPMQKKLDKFSKDLGFIIFGLVGIILILGLLRNLEFFDMFLVSVALAVGAIPEGLPAVLAIAFSISANILSKNNVIIRRLPAVESLGSVTVICTDKTGTITEEKMSVEEIYCDDFFVKKNGVLFKDGKKINVSENNNLDKLIQTSILCNNARFEGEGDKYNILGDSTEASLVELAYKLGYDKKKLTEKYKTVKKYEFDSDRKMMSIVREDDKGFVMHTKGASEKIIELSDYELVGGRVKRMSEKRKRELLEKSCEMEEKAYRVLGFSYNCFKKKSEFKESGFIFLGFMGMLDPPRKEVAMSIKECLSAGVKVKLITGDSLVTAKAISDRIGISGEVVSGVELEKMSDAELLRRIGNISIFARTTPHQKLRISKILQSEKEVVAMTGDGINDVLALKSADVGIAMGQRGVDVARDVSDIVLMDDNFSSIVEGVKRGRITYDNVKKFTKYMLAVNFDTILLVGILSSFGFLLPILPIQILWKNLVTDSFPALTLVFEKGENVMKTQPRKEKSILSGITRFIFMGGVLNFLACLAVYFIGLDKGIGIDGVRTMVVSTGIVFELLFVYVCRSSESLFKIGFFSNKLMNFAILVGIILHLIVIYGGCASIFHMTSLQLWQWGYIVAFGVSGLVLFEGFKLVRGIKKR